MTSASFFVGKTRPRKIMKLGLILVFFVFAASSVFFYISEIDVGFHIKTGQLIWQNRSIPIENTFSHTMPHHPWILHQWGGALAIYGVNQLGGVKAVILFRILLFLLCVVFLYLSLGGFVKGRLFTRCLILTLFIILARRMFFDRPLIFSAVFLSLLQYLVISIKAKEWFKWYIFVLMIIWVQMHGGYIYGALFLSCHCLGTVFMRENSTHSKDHKRLFMLLALFGLGGTALGVLILMIINPYGLKGALFPINCFFNPLYSEIIGEYQRPALLAYPVFYASLILLWFLIIIYRKKLFLGQILTIFAFSFLAVNTKRNILFYAITMLPFLFFLILQLTESWKLIIRKMFKDLIKFGSLLLLWIALFFFYILPDKAYSFGYGFHKPFYPFEIFNFIKENKLPGNMFNDVAFGGPSIWFLYPNYKVFIDGRFEAYSDEFWKKEYYQVLNTGKGWREILHKYGVTMCFLYYNSGEKPHFIGKILQETPNWRLVAFTDNAVLFLKDVSENVPITLQNGYHYLRPLDDSVDFITRDNAVQVAAEARRAMAFSPDSIRPKLFFARALLFGEQYPEAIKAYKPLLSVSGVASLAQNDTNYAVQRMLKNISREQCSDRKNAGKEF